jgi:hypothetical protein
VWRLCSSEVDIGEYINNKRAEDESRTPARTIHI